jgi:hypothetical protein
MAKLLEVKRVRDEENDCTVVCVRYDGVPTQEDLKALGSRNPFPWGHGERQALPSSYMPPEDGWWDVGQA